MDGHTRREVFTVAGVAGAAALLAGRGRAEPAGSLIVRNRSTTGVIVPPRGASFMKPSFDTPEPSVRFEGLEIGFAIFSRENAYYLDDKKLRVESIDDGIRVICEGVLWAGGQESAAGRLEATIRRVGAWIEWDATEIGRAHV